MLAPTFNGNNTPSAIENIFSDNSFYAFPNPFQDNLKVSKKDYYITNALGQKIYSSKFENTINTSSWHEGLYFLHFYNLQSSVKLIKIK
jgi:hypothetical protein